MLTETDLPAMVKVFISYSHDDKHFCDNIKKYLEQFGDRVNVWADDEIKAGDEWNETIEEKLREADIILFLVSIGFITSRYIKDNELAVGYARRQGGSAEIIPILLKECEWERVDELARFQALPIDPSDKRAQYIDKWDEDKRAPVYNSIARAIDKKASVIIKNRQVREKNERLQCYREKCQEFLSQSPDLELSIAHQDILREFREDRGIGEVEADEAFNEAKKPFLLRKENRNRYLDTVKRYLSVGSNLSAVQIQKELKDRQLALKLEDGDISALQPEIDRLTELQRAKEEEERRIREEEVNRGPALIQISADRGALVRVGNEWQQKTERITVSGYELELAECIAITMVQIPAGSFQMGSPATEAERETDEGPQHRVQLQSFFLGQTPVTQAQWQEVASWPRVEMMLNPNPAFFKGANRPVEQVSWQQAMEFCRRLSRRTKLFYTLPSEAQWEYACRASTTSPFAFGDTLTPDLSNYNGNYTYESGPNGQFRQETTEVGSFAANAWGLQDMHGNVWEWCLDHWHDDYRGAPSDGSAWVDGGESSFRLLRGGSWSNYPRHCRSACRIGGRLDARNGLVGFRLCRFPPGLVS